MGGQRPLSHPTAQGIPREAPWLWETLFFALGSADPDTAPGAGRGQCGVGPGGGTPRDQAALPGSSQAVTAERGSSVLPHAVTRHGPQGDPGHGSGSSCPQALAGTGLGVESPSCPVGHALWPVGHWVCGQRAGGRRVLKPLLDIRESPLPPQEQPHGSKGWVAALVGLDCPCPHPCPPQLSPGEHPAVSWQLPRAGGCSGWKHPRVLQGRWDGVCADGKGLQGGGMDGAAGGGTDGGEGTDGAERGREGRVRGRGKGGREGGREG